MSPELIQDIAVGLSALHTLGAGLGACAVLYAEWEYLQGHLGGTLTKGERRHLFATFFALRWGLSIVLLSGLALVIAEYLSPVAPSVIDFAPFWAGNTLVLVIILSGFLLSRKLIPFWIGGASALTAWWYVLVLDFLHAPTPSYGELMMSYLYTTVLIGFLLAFLRGLARAHGKRLTA